MIVGNKVKLNEKGLRLGCNAKKYKDSIGVIVPSISVYEDDGSSVWVEWDGGGYDDTWNYYIDQLSEVSEVRGVTELDTNKEITEAIKDILSVVIDCRERGYPLYPHIAEKLLIPFDKAIGDSDLYYLQCNLIKS